VSSFEERISVISAMTAKTFPPRLMSMAVVINVFGWEGQPSSVPHCLCHTAYDSLWSVFMHSHLAYLNVNPRNI
jgi:hypothetical protein